MRFHNVSPRMMASRELVSLCTLEARCLGQARGIPRDKRHIGFLYGRIPTWLSCDAFVPWLNLGCERSQAWYVMRNRIYGEWCNAVFAAASRVRRTTPRSKGFSDQAWISLSNITVGPLFVFFLITFSNCQLRTTTCES